MKNSPLFTTPEKNRSGVFFIGFDCDSWSWGPRQGPEAWDSGAYMFLSSSEEMSIYRP